MNRLVINEYDDDLGEMTTNDYVKLNNKKRLVKKYRINYDDFVDVLYTLGSEPKVLAYLIMKCNKLNQVNITYKQLCKALDMKISNIKRIMKKLQDQNVVKNMNGTITLNPFMYVKQGSMADTLQVTYMPMFKGDRR